MQQTPAQAITSDGWALLFNGQPVRVGDQLTDFRGDNMEVTGGTPPHKEGSTGRIDAREPGTTDSAQYYPGVVNCAWVRAAQ